MTTRGRQVVLAARPKGKPELTDFRLEETAIPTPAAGQLLLGVEYLSLDPYMRGRMNDGKSYAKPLELGEVMTGETVAHVLVSNNSAYVKGDVVLARTGWRTHALSDGTGLRKLDPVAAPVTTGLGVLGMPGFTAYGGLRAHCAVQRRPTGRRYGSAPRDDAAGSLEEADHTRLHQLRLRRRTLCRLPARGWCGRRRGSHSLPRGHHRRSRKRARRFHRNAGGAQLRQAHRPGGRLDSEVLADAQSRGDEQVAATTTPPLSRRSPRKRQRCSKSPNPPFRRGSRRRPRMSVEPDGLASSSSISQTIGGGHEIWHDRRRRCRARIRARGAGQGP